MVKDANQQQEEHQVHMLQKGCPIAQFVDLDLPVDHKCTVGRSHDINLLCNAVVLILCSTVSCYVSKSFASV